MPHKDPEKRREYNQRPDVKAKHRECERKRRQRPEVRAKQREYRQRPEVKARMKIQRHKSRLHREYGITEDEYLERIETQLGRCAICGEPLGDDVVVDHDHATGKFRGLTHANCNVGIGMFNDDPVLLERAAVYLRR